MKPETKKSISDFWHGIRTNQYDINELYQYARLLVISDDSIDRNSVNSDTELLDTLLNGNSSSRNGVENE